MKAVHETKILRHVPYETGYLSGCALFVPRKVLQRVGFLDERFFLYYEDADFSLRARRENFPAMIVPAAHAWHVEQSEYSNPQKIYWLVLSGLLFFHKNTPWFLRPWVWGYSALRRGKNLYDCTIKRTPTARMVRRAYYDYAQTRTQ